MFPLNLPNALTMLRILAVPVVVVALLVEMPNGDVIAAAVFAAAALTDGLDGYIARSRNSITTFGKLMDPLADKLLIIGALVSLVSLGRLEAWVAMVIIAREVAVTILRTIAAERGLVIAASWLGKAKTVLQIAAVIALIATNPVARLGRRARLRRRRGDDRQRRRLLLRPAQADRPAAARTRRRGLAVDGPKNADIEDFSAHQRGRAGCQRSASSMNQRKASAEPRPAPVLGASHGSQPRPSPDEPT